MIVIPMAGESRRFFEAGYNRPKYMLEAGGRTVFRHVLEGFHALFDSEPFLFVLRDLSGTREFVRRECEAMGIREARQVVLEKLTAGQAETVALGLRRAGVVDATPLTIFNIDTIRRGFAHPDEPDLALSDGYLEVFRGSGGNWSYVRPQSPSSTRVVETAEKREISDLCCTGLYHFARARDFLAAFDAPPEPQTEVERLERFVAPLYNRLIRRGADVRYRLVDLSQLSFCGTPSEYEAFCRSSAMEDQPSCAPRS